MKKTPMWAVAALVILVLASVALGALLVTAKKQIAAQADEIAGLRSQLAARHTDLQKSNAAAAEAEQKRTQFAAMAKAARQSLLEARQAAAAAPAVATAAVTPPPADADGGKKRPLSNPFTASIAKMMKDPAMKNMMRATQSTVQHQMYADLVKQWSLSPEETTTFYDLLLDKQMAQMDTGMEMMEKGSAAAAATPAGDADAQLKATLGDDLYKQYHDYEKTLPARMTVNQFQQQLAGSNATIMTPDQSNVLLQTITQEQAAQPPGSNLPAAGGSGGNPFGMDAAHLDQMMQAQADLNARIDARMANTLSPEQLQVLKQEQEQMIATQRMGMEMAAKMMAPSPTP